MATKEREYKERDYFDRKRKPTYNCPYFQRVNPTKPDVRAIKRNGEKWYTLECDCGRIMFPYSAFIDYRKKYCACEDVTAWKECTLAANMTEWYERNEHDK